jgi:hypothetical protein
MLMRVGTDGSSSQIDVQDFESESVTTTSGGGGGGGCIVLDGCTCCILTPRVGWMARLRDSIPRSMDSGQDSGSVTVTTGVLPAKFQMITNADQGVVFGWATNADTANYGFGSTVGGSASSGSISSPVFPVLQAQDGSFYGTDNNGDMIHFDQSGNVNWSVPNDSPYVATADGGVIGYSGTTYDSQGRATGQIANMPIQSWTGNAYQNDPGQAQQINFTPTSYATSFAASIGGNLSAAVGSGPNTYVQPIGQAVRDEIASVALGYVGSEKWLDNPVTDQNQCNLFVHDVLTQSGGAFAAPMESNWKFRLQYYFGLVNSPIYPALAGDWANPNKILSCWQTVPGGSDNALPGDVIAEAINYSGHATGHVGVVTGTQQTASADSAAPCFPPYAPAGIIDLSNYGFRPDNWVDPYKNSLGQPCRSYGKKSNAVVKRFVCQ